MISDPPLVNPVQRFSGSLAAWQDPSFLAPLAHVVHADEPSGTIPQLATPVPAADLPLATPPASAAAARPIQRAMTPTIGPSIVDTVATASAPIAEPAPMPVLRSAPVVQRVASAGPTGRIEMPATLPLAAIPEPFRARPAETSVQRHAGHDHGGAEPELDAQTYVQRSADDVPVARLADEEPETIASTLSVDAPSTLPLPTPAHAAEPVESAVSNLTLPSASRRFGLGEPLTSVPVQRSTVTPAPGPTPTPAGSPLPPVAPEPVSTPTIGAVPTPVRPVPPATEIVSVGPPPLPLLAPVQRIASADQPATQRFAEPFRTESPRQPT
ncbi:MAG TPA: hypothetical protein VGJ28_11525, partial [Micromonosporaceae bacterium]